MYNSGQYGYPASTKSSSSNTIMYIILFICILYYCTIMSSICTAGIIHIYDTQQANKIASQNAAAAEDAVNAAANIAGNISDNFTKNEKEIMNQNNF